MSRNSPAGRAYPDDLRAYILARHREDNWKPVRISGEAAALWPNDPITAVSVSRIIAFETKPSPRQSARLVPFVAKRPANQFCQLKRYQNGRLELCLADTRGHTYCPECAAELTRGPNQRRYNYMPGGKVFTA